MSTHKGSRSRSLVCVDVQRAGLVTNEPPRAHTATKSASSSDPPKPLSNGEPEGSNTGEMASTTKPSEASDNQ